MGILNWLKRGKIGKQGLKENRRGWGLSFEQLEDRVVPSTWSVINTGSSVNVPGSLPWAVANANLDESNSAILIDFNSTLKGLTISLASTLKLDNSAGKTIQIDGPQGGITLAGGGKNTSFSIFQVEASNTVILNGLTLVNGCSSQGSAVANFGTLTLQNCTVSNNSSTSGGYFSNLGYTGAVFNDGRMTIDNCVFDSNTARSLNNSNAYLNGYGGAVHNAGTMSITGSTFSNNTAGGSKGGEGGAIFNSGTLDLVNCTLNANSTNDGGGAIFNYQGRLEVSGCTFKNNTGTSGGGAVANYQGTIDLANATFQGNTTTGGGGGLFNFSGTMTVTNVTLARNTANSGGGIYNNSGSLLLQNSIVALNTATTGKADLDGINLNTASHHNLIGTGGTGGMVNKVKGNILGVANPGLSTLGNYGGPTQTIGLLPGSPGLDAGDDEVVPGTTDQRGKERVVNDTVDMGAFESRGFTLGISTGDDQATYVGKPFGQALVVTITANNAVEPVNGGKVTFSVPSSGASAVLASPVPTISAGKATVNATANATSGSYQVKAETLGAAHIVFDLTNHPVAQLGALSITVWTVNQDNYVGTISVTGGTGAYTNLVVTGLPTGLSASLSGETINISGTPTQTGVFQAVKVSLQDGGGGTATATYTLTIQAALTLGNLSRTAWTVNQANYVGTIAIQGGTGPFSSANVTVSGLPGGLTSTIVGSTIKITGTPTEAGENTLTVSVQDTTGATGSSSQSLTINAAPTLSDLVGGTAWTKGRAYQGTINITSGTGTFSKLLVTGLPSGLKASFAGNTISIKGKPVQTGNFNNIAVSIQDSTESRVIGTYGLVVNAPATLGNLTTKTWTVNQNGYTGTITIKGGTAAFTNLAVTGLPTGMTAALADNVITLSGIPTQAGTKSVNVSVLDKTGLKVQGVYSLNIQAGPSLGNLSPTGWTVNQANYAGSISISGGTGPYTVESFTGLPAGLSYVVTGNTIKISGTPTVVDSSAMDILIKDAAGATGEGHFTLTVNAALSLGTLSKPGWNKGLSYQDTISVSGGTGTYKNFTLSGLPTGLTAKLVGNTINITGKPTQVGTFKTVTFSLQDSIGVKVRVVYTMIIREAPVLGSLNKTVWTVDQPGYEGLMAITKGTAPYSIGSISGLPAGLEASVVGTNLVVSGTPTQAGTFDTINLMLQDGTGTKFSRTASLTIQPMPTLGGLSITLWGINQVNYAGSVVITGGTGPFTLVDLTGLPVGLTGVMSGNTVKISGTPTASGIFSIYLKVKDTTGAEVDKNFSLTIS